MVEPGDAELMSSVRAGDKESFALIVDRHKDAIVSYLCRLTGSRDRAEELAQEACVRLYESAPSYRESGRLRPLLFRIATNLVRSEERRARSRRALARLIGLNGHAREPAPDASLLHDEMQRSVVRALAGLPVGHRAPLVLAEVEGLSYSEIALLLRCRVGTVKSRIHRAKERLRRELASYVARETS